MPNVTLYERPSGERIYFYADISDSGKRKQKSLGISILKKPKTEVEKSENRKYRRLAEDAVNAMRLELRANNVGLKALVTGNTDFLEFFDDYAKKYPNADYKKIRAAHTHFKDFAGTKGLLTLPAKSLSLTLCEDFAEYLKRRLKGETPKAYFRVFKTVLIRARKEGLTNLLTQDIKVSFKNDTAIKKPLLSSAEVKLLEQTDCPNKEIKRAVLFSLNTGFDFATVSRVLKWEHLDGNSIIFDRSKTDSQNRFPLNAKALALLGTPGKKKDLIFTLPTWEGTVKAIRAWAKEAGINKKLTYHSLRHSFGYILRNEHKVDIGTLGDLLGHKDIKTTKRYEHLDESTKRAAVDKL